MKIAIAGYGAEGKANYSYWNSPENELTIVDERESVDDLPEGAANILGEGAFSRLADFDMVVRTASLRPDKISTNGKVWSATNEFFTKCPASIIGVTGTKGKGTTCSLITSILRAAGKTVHLVGNIGVPALSELVKIQPGDIVVYEMSSFQLWDAQKSPHVAVLLMIEPDHMDIHASLDEYIAAKANITKFQSESDVLVYNQKNSFSAKIAESSKAQKIPFGSDDGEFYVGDEEVAHRASLQLPGRHNIDNANAAILAAWQFTQDTTAFDNGLQAFTGLEHRLKFVREVDNVRYYDDSIATTPGSAIAALRSFEQKKVLILGGSDKGSDYTELLTVCRDSATKVIAIGAIGKDIAEIASSLGTVCVREEGSMTEIVAKAHEVAKPGEVVILSPAAASFDMFKNYKDRGEQFIRAVEQL